MSRPVVSQEAEDLYAALGPWAANDVTTPEPKVSLVPNGAFNRDTIGQPPVGWVTEIGTAPVVSGTVISGGVGNSCSFGAGPTEINRYAMATFAPVQPSVNYTISGRYQQVQMSAPGFRWQIRWYDKNQALLSTDSAPLSGNIGNGSAATYSFAAASPATAAFAKIVLDHPNNDFFTIRLDNVMFAPTAQGATYFDGDSAGTGLDDWTWTGTPGNSISVTPDVTYPLLTLCEAIAGRLTQIEEVIRDDSTTGDLGWSIVMDVDRAPSEWLGWLAQFAGVRLLPGLSDADQRTRIKNTDGFKRGSPTAIVAAAQAFLTGGKTVYLTERHGSAYRLTVATKAAETPNLAALTAAVLAQKPAGIVLAVTTVVGTDYATLRDTHNSYTDVKNTYVDYTEVLSNPSKQ